ncbi:hypothetical protein HZ326_31199 [Fusarium oxysporum f. sp. albedinis]|nr:hypothetical protein HZ326_31199 [Fusarium oxysporum f. sp. albedinis]
MPTSTDSRVEIICPLKSCSSMNRILLFRRRHLSLRIAYIQYEQIEENANAIKVLSAYSGLSVPTPTQCSLRQRRWQCC